MKITNVLVILALLVFVTGCGTSTQPAQSPSAPVATPSVNNAPASQPVTPVATPVPAPVATAPTISASTSGVISVPTDIVGSNPDPGTVQTSGTDAAGLSS